MLDPLSFINHVVCELYVFFMYFGYQSLIRRDLQTFSAVQ